MHSQTAADRLGVPRPVRKKFVDLAVGLHRFAIRRVRSRGPEQTVAASVLASLELTISARVCQTTAKACCFKIGFPPIMDAYLDLRAALAAAAAELGSRPPMFSLTNAELVLATYEYV
jgi:hypothetical protein